MPASADDRLTNRWEVDLLPGPFTGLLLRPRRHQGPPPIGKADARACKAVTTSASHGARDDHRLGRPAAGNNSGSAASRPKAGSDTRLARIPATLDHGHGELPRRALRYVPARPRRAARSRHLSREGVRTSRDPLAPQPGPGMSTVRPCAVNFDRACRCRAGTVPGVVLDPFFGAGTVGVVAEAHGRDWIGIELNPVFAQLARQRIAAARTQAKEATHARRSKRSRAADVTT